MKILYDERNRLRGDNKTRTASALSTEETNAETQYPAML